MDNHLQEKQWVCDWGEFVIPDDVPVSQFRKDGWFDRRRKITKQLRAYFNAMSDRLRDGRPVDGWAEFHASESQARDNRAVCG